MPSNAFQLGKLLMSSGKVEISPENVSDDFSTIEQVSSTDALSASGNAVGDQRIVGNNLYIWNGSGWYRIALINETPTWDSGGQPSTSYILDTDSPQDATVITLAASDPDGLPIQYSYVTGGSMDSMATISQDSSVFTIVPKTVSEVGEGAELTGSITFRASDGINILPQVSSFTLNFISVVENSRYTTLLATAVDTSDNNNITDSSTNNHTITVTGDAHAGTFSPYRHGGYSTYFDGNGDYINAPSSHSSFALGTNDFTYECWFYPQNLTGCLVSKHSAGAPQWFELRVSSGYIYVGIAFSNAWGPMQTGTIPVPANKWCHVALVRNGSSFSVFVNGVLDISISNTGSISNNTSYPFRIGARGAADLPYNGYISDARLVNGTALYTSNFTPPTERLTAITNTSVLTCHLPYIADGSSNAHAITINGNTSTKPFGPYDYANYSESINGGSVYFDGSDYLQLSATATDLLPETSNTTIEAWVNTTGTGHVSVFSNFNPPSPFNGMEVGLYNGYQTIYSQGSWINNTGGTGVSTINDGSWHHLAWVITNSGATVTTYVDGVQNYTSSITASTTGSSNQRIGASSNTTVNRHFTGHISDFRFTKGTAVYTSDFTPPTAQLSSTGSALHIKGTDASIIDKSQGSNLTLVGNTTGSTTQVKFANTKSMYFDGTGDYVTADQIPLGTGDFTIEAYTYLDARLTSFPAIFSNYNSFAAGALSLFAGHNSSTTTNYQVAHNGAGFPSINGGPITYDQWVHLCVERYNGTITLYKNGSSVGSFSSTLALNGVGSNFYIGASGDSLSTSYINGWIQDFRVTTGLARYTTNFTPPTEPLKG